MHTILQKLAKVGRRNIGTQPCPEIRWSEVVQVLALGTDMFGRFEVSLVFFHKDGTEARLCVEHRGYDKILESLSEKFPSIPPTWLDTFNKNSGDVETILYSPDS